MIVLIESALITDLPVILALLERCGLPTAGFAERLPTALVARADGDVVGSAALELYGAAALLRSVAVDEAFRGQGLGVRLTQAALDLARQRGVTHVYLLTTTAGEFFPRFGFQPVAREDVPEAVKQSVEFTSACPVSALAMARRL
jgi:amino-acid N-acetyltransferase